jgi:hypothetical protein
MNDEQLPQATAPGHPAPWPGPEVGADAVDPRTTPPPPNHLLAAILSTVFCFMPFGIVSIIKASQVNTLWWQGRVEESVRASESARTWAIAAVVAAVVVFVGTVLLGTVVSVTVGGGDATGVEVGP